MYEADWEQTRMRFFEPGLDGRAELSPFYYTQHWLYGSDDDPMGDDLRRNCREWQSYLGADVPLADIDTVLYGGTKPDDILTPLKINGLQQRFPRNLFIKKLLQPQHRAALEYLQFIMEIEFVQNAEQDPWFEYGQGMQPDTTFFNMDTAVTTLCRKSFDRLQASAANPFLEKRYAYQTIVCNRYYGSDSLAVAVFDRYFNLRDTTVLMPWALIHKAQCRQQAGDSLGYNYLLSRVFDGCNTKKIRAAELFVTKNTEATLALAPNGAEKAVVLTMQALQYPGRGMSLLRRIAGFDPGCRYLPLLISREINKLEDWTMTLKMTGYDIRPTPESFYDELYSDDAPQNAYEIFDRKRAAWRRNNLIKDRAYLHELRDWVEAQARNNSLPGQRDFLQLAAAHLNFLEGNYAVAQSFLAKMSAKAAPRLLLQRDVETLLLMPYTHNLREPAAQNALSQQLRRIWAQKRYLDKPALQLSRLHFYCCHAMFRVGDIPAAGLFYNKAFLTSNEGGTMYSFYNQTEFFDAHATVADLDKLILLAKKGGNTAFERYLLETPPDLTDEEAQTNPDVFWWFDGSETVPPPLPKLNELLELQGTIAFREGDLKRSLAVFEQIPDTFWAGDNTLRVNIFADATHFPFGDSIEKRGGKVEIVRQMLALEKESSSARGDRLAEICYQMGNGWFNCSYWGKSWYMFSYNRSYDDTDAPEVREAGNFPGTPDVRKYGGAYFRFDRALAWYRRALAANPPKELAAKIEYMIADCDRYVRIMHSDSDYYGYDEDIKLPSSSLFRQWARRYGRTATFAERMEHCPDLRTYLGF